MQSVVQGDAEVVDGRLLAGVDEVGTADCISIERNEHAGCAAMLGRSDVAEPLDPNRAVLDRTSSFFDGSQTWGVWSAVRQLTTKCPVE